MLLNDIGRVPATALRKINQYLQSNYGFKLTENIQKEDIATIMETIQCEIADLKIKGADAKASPEITKRLLVLEGLKTLNEFAILQFQSPKLELVINSMIDFVVDSFHKSGTSMSDFDECVKDAMKEYRSSKYRFPDNYIEQRVREGARNAITSGSTADEVLPMMEDELSPDGLSLDDSLQEEGYTPLASNEDYIDRLKTLRKIQMSPSTSADPALKNELAKRLAALKAEASAAGFLPGAGSSSQVRVPTVLNRQNKPPMQDPFVANKLARQQGRVNPMESNKNLVKHLRALLETEVSQAEVMMAAKGFAQELQEMVEKIGRLQNEDLPPVTDQMRETYGMESASAFQTQIYGALQSVMDSLYTAKGQVDDAVGSMASTGQVSASNDMDADMGGDMDADMGGDDMDMEPELDLDNIGDEVESDVPVDGEEPLGRSMKTEAALQHKVMEMKKLVAKARKLKEEKEEEQEDLDEVTKVFHKGSRVPKGHPDADQQRPAAAAAAKSARASGNLTPARKGMDSKSGDVTVVRGVKR